MEDGRLATAPEGLTGSGCAGESVVGGVERGAGHEPARGERIRVGKQEISERSLQPGPHFNEVTDANGFRKGRGGPG
jgi:hypothetical protein